MKEKKNVKIISFVHDVEELRIYRYNEYYRREMETMLRLADVIIVHNDQMKAFFTENGCDESKLVELGIFDYLMADSEIKQTRFANTINIAGNLDAKKSSYIAQLNELEGVKINLFGINYDSNLTATFIEYKGKFNPEEIPHQFTEGFGLVWDGNSIDSCAGFSGEYLKYNDPHKTSLYLASGLPVIVWSQAAISKFVLKEGCGIAVDSLRNIAPLLEKMTEADYRELSMNAARVGLKLRTGYYVKNALTMDYSLL